jgi:zinc transporter ZupT
MKYSVDRKKPRYKYKMNMLEPGIVMLKIVVALLLVAAVLYLTSNSFLAFCLLFIAGFIFLLMIILILIEQHQDKVLYENAKKEDSEIK